MECITCDSILTDYTTQDWNGKGGHCDTCSEYLADASLMREQGREQQSIDNYRNN
jgi:hypothetical protein